MASANINMETAQGIILKVYGSIKYSTPCIYETNSEK